MVIDGEVASNSLNEGTMCSDNVEGIFNDVCAFDVEQS